jgi:hypothetical protein
MTFTDSGETMVDCSFTADYNGMAQVVKIGTTKINDSEYYTHLAVSFEHVPEPVGKDVMKLLTINRMIYR